MLISKEFLGPMTRQARLHRSKTKGDNKTHPMDVREREMPLPLFPESPDVCLGKKPALKSVKIITDNNNY